MISLNCLYLSRPRPRLRAIARRLKEMAPDVACLQEVFFRRNVPLLDDRRALFRPWGLGVVGGVVTIANGDVQELRFEQYRDTVWMERIARKGILFTRLVRDGETLAILNTHLIANYDNNWALDNRYTRVQIKELAQLAAAVNRVPRDQLLIVAGDFNTPASSPQFRDFMTGCGLLAALDWATVPVGARGHREIDNILCRPPTGRTLSARAELCFTEQVRLDDGRAVYPSDHVGVVAELEW